MQLNEENAQMKELIALKDKEIKALKEKSTESLFLFHARMYEAEQNIEQLNAQLGMLQTTDIAASLSEELLLAKFGEVPEIGSVMTFLDTEEQMRAGPECDCSSGSDGHQDSNQTAPDAHTSRCFEREEPKSPSAGKYIFSADLNDVSNRSDPTPEPNSGKNVSALAALKERLTRFIVQAWSLCAPSRASPSPSTYVLIPIAITIGLIVPYYSRRLLSTSHQPK